MAWVSITVRLSLQPLCFSSTISYIKFTKKFIIAGWPKERTAWLSFLFIHFPFANPTVILSALPSLTTTMALDTAAGLSFFPLCFSIMPTVLKSKEEIRSKKDWRAKYLISERSQLRRLKLASAQFGQTGLCSHLLFQWALQVDILIYPKCRRAQKPLN